MFKFLETIRDDLKGSPERTVDRIDDLPKSGERRILPLLMRLESVAVVYGSDDHSQTTQVNLPFHDVVGGSELHRLNRNVFRTGSCQHNRRQLNFLLVQPLEHIQARHASELIVQEEDVKLTLFQHLKRDLSRFTRPRSILCGRRKVCNEGAQKGRFVVNDENTYHALIHERHALPGMRTGGVHAPARGDTEGVPPTQP